MKHFARFAAAALIAFLPLRAIAQIGPDAGLSVGQTPVQGGSSGQCLYILTGKLQSQACGGAGTVTSVSVTTANGVSGSVATATTTPAISLTLGAITPTTVNGNTITTGTGTLTLGSVTLNAGAGGTLGSNAFTSTTYAPLASPTFTGTVTIPNGGVFGTPTSVTLSNATGLPVATGISGLGTGVATWLATPSSANLAAALTDETGSGVAVFATSPTLASPTFTGTVTQPAALNFKVHLAVSQSITGSAAKINYDTVDFDATTAWSVANHNFNPQVAGTYLICSATAVLGTFVITNASSVYVSKNGLAGGAGTVVATYNQTYANTVSGGAPQSGCVLVPMNGSSDTIEVDASSGGTSPSVQGAAAPNIVTYLTGYRIGS